MHHFLLQEQKRQRLTTGGTTPDGRPTTPIEAATEAADAAATAASPGSAGGAASAAAGGAPPSPPPAAAAPVLPKQEVIRRLRALGQPVTLFGEEDADRQARLVKVEKTVALVDETRGGGENVMLMLKRQEKAKAKQSGGDKAAAADKAASSKAAAASAGGAGEGPAKPGKASEGGAAAAAADAGAGAGSSSGAGGTAGSSDADALIESFKAAAARLAEQRADDALDVEDKMIKMIKEWCVEWEADLEARPEDVSSIQALAKRLAQSYKPTHTCAALARQRTSCFEQQLPLLLPKAQKHSSSQAALSTCSCCNRPPMHVIASQSPSAAHAHEVC